MDGSPVSWRRGEFEISTDATRVDLETVHRFLSEQAYWSPGVPLDVVRRAIEGSVVFGVYRMGERAEQSEQVGFARVVTDKATFGWIGDVFVVERHRGQGLSKWLMECIFAHPDLQGFRRWMLATRDAQGLYAQYGFTPLHDPTRFMERWDPDVYSLGRETAVIREGDRT